MTKRYIPLLAAIACLSVAGSPAFATDDPPAAPPAAAPPADTPATPTTAPTAPACTDTKRPTTKVKSTARGATRSHKLQGSASDVGCTTNSVSRVSVSIALKKGKSCQFLTRTSKLSRAGKCTKPQYLTAVGTKTWRVNLPRHMKHGSYQILTRAVDSAGNVERAHAQRLAIR